MNKANEVAQGLSKLKEDYRARLPDDLATIVESWLLICADGWDDARARSIHQTCHHLAGTGKTFGFSSITTYARVVESQLNSIFDAGGVPSVEETNSLGVAIQQLMDLGPVEDVVGGSRTPAPPKAVPRYKPTVAEDPSVPRVEPLSNLPIFIVEDDKPLADHLVMELALQGYDGRAVYELADLDRQIRESGMKPGAIVMDVIFPDAMTGGIDIINEFRRDQVLKAPVIFISASDSFETRLKIVRAGGDAFFVKPFDTNLLIEKIEALVGETDPDPLRVLVVDDDHQFAELTCLILEQAGLNAIHINDPTKTITKVLEFHPDLVLLDMNMPSASGMEVAKILRQHESCESLPLLFLSAESDPKVRAAALNIGVDDFLVKPVDQPYLISAVANRAQRARANQSRIFRDSLTHLLVHDEIKNQLAEHLSNSRRYKRKLCYVILDLDKFKLVNDTYGHLTGDHVIKSLASLLRRSFRRSDVLGRYGGEEFVVIMLDTDVDDALVVLNRVREEFAEILHKSEAGGTEFYSSFSAGIAAFPQFDEPQLLQENADRALYEAKETGRNRICIARS